MARKLSKKARGFVKDYAETGNGTQAALQNYEIEGKNKENIAAAIATENLTKPQIQEELKRLGFDEDNADRVVANILNNEVVEPKDRLKAADLVYKRRGSYAPDRHLNVNISTVLDEIEHE